RDSAESLFPGRRPLILGLEEFGSKPGLKGKRKEDLIDFSLVDELEREKGNSKRWLASRPEHARLSFFLHVSLNPDIIEARQRVFFQHALTALRLVQNCYLLALQTAISCQKKSCLAFFIKHLTYCSQGIGKAVRLRHRIGITPWGPALFIEAIDLCQRIQKLRIHES